MTNIKRKLPRLPSTALAPKEPSTPAINDESVAKKEKGNSLPPIPKDFAKNLFPSITNGDPEFALFLLVQATGTDLPFSGSPPDWNGTFIESAIRSIAPRDGLEALLAVQMVQTHNLALVYLGRAGSKTQTALGIEMFANFANRLLRTFTAQMETLKSYRTKGEQKVEVKHVHVNRGGQAVVGTVNHTTGGGDGDKK